MEPIRATLRLRNHRLTTLREELGLSQAELARRLGVTASYYNSLETMRKSPVGADGWLPTAEKIAKYHGVDASYLWPDAVCAIRQTVYTREVSIEEAALMAGTARPAIGPGEMMDHDDTIQEIEHALAELPAREADVIARRFGLSGEHQTQDEIGIRHGVSKTRVMQIENRALHKLLASVDVT
jgi:RNA polymerase sigma factor (sigma-70 family)